MIEVNTTSIVNQITPFFSIIGPIIVVFITAVVGILATKYNNDRTIRKHQRVVARAFFEEISSYFDAFNLLLENYNTLQFDEAFNDLDHEGHARDFLILALHQIVNLEIATTGPYATFLRERNAFTVFYEDIYKFNDIQTTRNLLQLNRYLVTADMHYHNYCHDQMHPVTDFRAFLDTIENATNLIRDESILDDLETKFQTDISIREKVSVLLFKE
jgi:hypothetical protein